MPTATIVAPARRARTVTSPTRTPARSIPHKVGQSLRRQTSPALTRSGVTGTVETGPAVARRAAFEAWYAEYYRGIRLWLAGRVHSWDLADDLAQATFGTLWDKVASGAVDPTTITAPYTWLRRWADQQIRRHFDTPHARTEHPVAPEHLRHHGFPPAHAGEAAAVVDRLDVARLLTGVAVPARQVLALHLLDDLDLPEVAALTGIPQPHARRLLGEGIDRIRDLLGVAPDQIAAHHHADRAAHLRWRLKTLAHAPAGRQTRFRTGLLAAIAEGTYPPGTRMPPTSVLANRHAPTEPTPRNQDASIAAHLLHSLTLHRILTGTPTTGYTVTQDGPRLAAAHQQPVPAAQALARELLAGTWPPGTLLPTHRALGRRWHADALKSVLPALDRLVELGALIRTPGGRYYTTPEPGTQFTPDPRAEPAPRRPHAEVLADVVTEATATGRVPTIRQIKATHRVGGNTAVRIRAAATTAAAAPAPPVTQAPPAAQYTAQLAAEVRADLNAQTALKADHGHDPAHHELDLDEPALDDALGLDDGPDLTDDLGL